MSDIDLLNTNTVTGGSVLNPSASRRAVIDIGTNSIKLLVAEVDGRGVRPLLETSEQTRLGRGFYRTHQLQTTAIEASLKAITEFAHQARSLGAASIRLIATSAVRDAKNSGVFTSGIHHATGLDVEVISGEQEADWAFAGVATNSRQSGHPLLVLDVGGGSTEFIYGEGEHAAFRQSYPIGTVRLMEDWVLSDPPTAEQFALAQSSVVAFLRDQVLPQVGPCLHQGEGLQVRLIGTGGTPAILARIKLGLDAYDREQIEALQLTLADLEAMTRNLWELSLADRMELRGMPPQRADVILCGAMIYLGVMRVFGFHRLDISTRGLRFAVVAAMS